MLENIYSFRGTLGHYTRTLKSSQAYHGDEAVALAEAIYILLHVKK
jgi:hypothetical protein